MTVVLPAQPDRAAELVGDVDAELSALHQERSAWEAEYIRKKSEWRSKKANLLRARRALSRINEEPIDPNSPVKLSVSPEKLAEVLAYVEMHGPVRQAEIHKALGLNSGSVSMALRILATDKQVTRHTKEAGSTLWSVRTADHHDNAASM